MEGMTSSLAFEICPFFSVSFFFNSPYDHVVQLHFAKVSVGCVCEIHVEGVREIVHDWLVSEEGRKGRRSAG